MVPYVDAEDREEDEAARHRSSSSSRGRTRRRKADDFLAPDVEKAMEDVKIRNEFEVFAKGCYNVENVRFLIAAKHFKSEFYAHDENWRWHKAKAILETFIRRDSLLEINISERDRVKIESVFYLIKGTAQGEKPARSKIAFDLFDTAIKEIAVILNGGAFHDFWETRGGGNE